MSTKKKVLIVVGAAVVLAIIIGVSVTANRKDATTVETGEVKRTAELVAIVTATGEIKPKEFVELQAEISGVITELLVEEGDLVTKGDLLLKIDPVQTRSDNRAQEAMLASALSDVRSQQAQIAVQESVVEQDRTAVRVAEIEVETAQKNLDLAQSIFERKQGLFEENLISRDDYDTVKNNLYNAESTLATAKGRLLQAEAQFKVRELMLEQARESHGASLSRAEQQRAMLERSQDMLSKTEIRSPLDGVITQMNVEVGERAVPGTLNNPAATLMIIADLSIIEAEVEVDETDIVDLELGQKAVVKVDALPDNPIDGIVTEIGNSAIQILGQEQEAKDFKVVIQLDEPPKSLRPGLSCTGEITTAVRAEVLSIPIQALTIREFPVDEEGVLVRKEKDEDKKETDAGKGDKDDELETKEFEGVFRLVETKVEFVPVETGITGDKEIEILAGLEEDDTIVTGSYKTLRTLGDGDSVEVEEEQEEGS
ncbi:MAG TPA: HlyD family secretion protein [Acidobacteriota bacterium]|nr:HlyD family secretion protein [Acidobacteriota bacterium]